MPQTFSGKNTWNEAKENPPYQLIQMKLITVPIIRKKNTSIFVSFLQG